MNRPTIPEIALTVSVIIIATTVLWLCTKRGPKVAAQWRWPLWPVARIALLFVCFHVIFAALTVPVAHGYLFLFAFVLVSLSGWFFDPLAVLLLVTAWMFYEWVFWFPTRRELILAHTLAKSHRCEHELNGELAEALSDLKPMGRVLLGGKIRDARSSCGFILKGARVKIESSGGFELVVSKVEDVAPRLHPRH